MSFSIIMIIKKIFSVILRLSNNTKYLRPEDLVMVLSLLFLCGKLFNKTPFKYFDFAVYSTCVSKR